MRNVREAVEAIMDGTETAREVFVSSRAVTKVLGRRGNKWYLRKMRESDKLKLTATEGGGVGSPDPT